MPTPLPLAECATALGVGRSTLRTWIRCGCPVIERGGGRARHSLVDVDAAREWRRARDAADAAEARWVRLGVELPALISAAVERAYRRLDEPAKRRLADAYAAAATAAINAALDRMQSDCPRVPGMSVFPPSLERLRAIGADAT